MAGTPGGGKAPQLRAVACDRPSLERRRGNAPERLGLSCDADPPEAAQARTDGVAGERAIERVGIGEPREMGLLRSGPHGGVVGEDVIAMEEPERNGDGGGASLADRADEPLGDLRIARIPSVLIVTKRQPDGAGAEQRERLGVFLPPHVHHVVLGAEAAVTVPRAKPPLARPRREHRDDDHGRMRGDEVAAREHGIVAVRRHHDEPREVQAVT